MLFLLQHILMLNSRNFNGLQNISMIIIIVYVIIIPLATGGGIIT